MKKLFSVVLVLSFVFLLCSCFDKIEDKDKDEGQSPVFSITSEKNQVSPGENITVILNLSSAKKVACFDVSIDVSGDAKYVNSSGGNLGDLIANTNYDQGSVVVSACVATTTQIDDNDLYAFTYTISEDAKTGDIIEFAPSVSTFQVGTDETGDNIVSIVDSVVKVPLKITVK